MVDYVLIPGAGGDAFFWHLVVEELDRRGRTAVAVDLPGADETASFPEYADAVVAAAGTDGGFVLAAQSMGGFTAPLVCERVPVDLVVLLNAMIPAPGETAGEWWAATGSEAARRAAAERDGRRLEDDPDFTDAFFHDVPADVRAEAFRRGAPQESDRSFAGPPSPGWPNVPTRVLVGRDDRFFPAEFQRRVAKERLGLDADEMPGGHLVALSRPVELTDRLERYRGEQRAAAR